MGIRLLATFTLVVLFASPPIGATGGWNDPTSDQYHIQTDEGPERYFRYQTESGQYRKEKRLEDGTVVGSYGWIDSDGFLRLRDYIADNAGYRILRTKNVYVGRNRPISQAIKAAKKVPSSAGVLTNTKTTNYVPPTTNQLVSTTTQSPPTVSSTPATNLYTPSSTPYPADVYTPSSTPAPALYIPPSTPAVNEQTQYTASPTPKTPTINPYESIPSTYLSTPSPFTPPVTETNYIPSTQSPPTIYITSKPQFNTQPTIAPAINSNSLDYSPQYEHYDQNPYIHHNGPTYPIDRHGNTYHGLNQIGNGYDPQYPSYDGVSVTNDGFRYYIPRAYHEEQNVGEDNKAGSFGYIDPFGIRRVIYYNAGANGFQHRKNNRYVGFDATPYDPRPYSK
ncbi:PREDICTED: cell surface glycoprotein 1 [Nicrophorus vespilloides]|uniref:Cell surface glycoprotein 1 n=1 Tax=Nicrophorus vespilloides TaxID=110193 RepID=A0ABM1NJ18_NICVS|nr:PREDICTED: cell surface glycoprotein 1 [Nicrophorus vespilloides]